MAVERRANPEIFHYVQNDVIFVPSFYAGYIFVTHECVGCVVIVCRVEWLKYDVVYSIVGIIITPARV